MAAPLPGDEPDPVEPDPVEPDPDDDEDQGDEQPARPARSTGIAQDGAGWVLGLLLWGWVVLPFIKGGPAQVGKTLRAKFLNQAADGSELP